MYPTHDPDARDEGCCWTPTPEAEAVIAAFEQLPAQERDCVLVELLCRSPPRPCPWPSDAELAAAADFLLGLEPSEPEDA